MDEAINGSAGMLSMFIPSYLFFGLPVKDVADNMRKYGTSS